MAVLPSASVRSSVPRWAVTSLTWMWLLAVAAGVGLVIADKLPHGRPGGCTTGVDGDPLAAWFGLVMCISAVITLVVLAVLTRDPRSSSEGDAGPTEISRPHRAAGLRAAVVPVLAGGLAFGGLWLFALGGTSFLVVCGGR